MERRQFSALVAVERLSIGSLHAEFIGPSIGQLAAAAGCDFVMIDMEHSGFSFETVKAGLRFVHDAGLASLVRVPAKDYHFIARCCDVGAQGVMVPMTETAEEARAVVHHAKYPPLGRRGIAFGVAHDDYRPGAMAAKMERGNARTAVVAMIETARGVENVDAVAAVEGVDCLWIGPGDLSASLGIPGDFANSRFISAVAAIRAAAHKHGKGLGSPVQGAADAVRQHAAGLNMATFGGDIWILQSALAAGIAEIRAGLEAVGKEATQGAHDG